MAERLVAEQRKGARHWAPLDRCHQWSVPLATASRETCWAIALPWSSTAHNSSKYTPSEQQHSRQIQGRPKHVQVMTEKMRLSECVLHRKEIHELWLG